MTRGGIIKILPINSHIECRPLARPLSLLSLQSQWVGEEWPDGKSCHYGLARFISGFPGQMRSRGSHTRLLFPLTIHWTIGAIKTSPASCRHRDTTFQHNCSLNLASVIFVCNSSHMSSMSNCLPLSVQRSFTVPWPPVA